MSSESAGKDESPLFIVGFKATCTHGRERRPTSTGAGVIADAPGGQNGLRSPIRPRQLR